MYTNTDPFASAATVIARVQRRIDNDAARRTKEACDNFKPVFANSVLNHGERNWLPSAIQASVEYGRALLSEEDVPLPKIDPGIARTVQELFVKHLSSHPGVPENHFNGQRQSWCRPKKGEVIKTQPCAEEEENEDGDDVTDGTEEVENHHGSLVYSTSSQPGSPSKPAFTTGGKVGKQAAKSAA